MPAIVRQFILLMLTAVVLQACGSKSGKSFLPSIHGYAEKQKQVFVLNEALLEISGIAHLGGDTLAAVNDEKGELFVVNLVTEIFRKQKFGGKGDYEEIVKTDSAFYVLESQGHIIEINSDTDKVKTYKLKVKGKAEFESLVWYKKLNKLVMITKEQRKKVQAITAYSFDIATKTFDPDPFFDITFREVMIKLENYNAECKPSAAALHPVTEKLYILASVGKLILQCTAEGKLEKIYKINPTHFPQPEGITFAANGDMYISNEGLDGKGTVLKFPYAGSK